MILAKKRPRNMTNYKILLNEEVIAGERLCMRLKEGAGTRRFRSGTPSRQAGRPAGERRASLGIEFFDI